MPNVNYEEEGVSSIDAIFGVAAEQQAAQQSPHYVDEIKRLNRKAEGALKFIGELGIKLEPYSNLGEPPQVNEATGDPNERTQMDKVIWELEDNLDSIQDVIVTLTKNFKG